MNTISFKDPDFGVTETGLAPELDVTKFLVSNNDNAQLVSIERLRDAYHTGISSGPSIQITVAELLVRFKADLNEQS